MAAIALAITSAPADAASTRAEYVTQVDQVCTGYAPQFQILGRKLDKLTAKFDVTRTESDAQEKRRLNRLYRGIGQYVSGSARVRGAMIDQLVTVPAAPGDEAAVAQWMVGLRRFNDLQAQSAPAWRHRKLARIIPLSDQSIEALNSGGAAVAGFGISACLTHIDVPETTYSDASHG
jgi:hypothetical protein